MTVVGMLAIAGDVGGQAQYESALLHAVNGLHEDVRLQQLRVTSMRSAAVAELRLPYERLCRAPLSVQRLAMRAALPKLDLIHRCDLRLPSSAAEVLTIHDTAWRRFSDAPAPSEVSLRSVLDARRVIVPSCFAADELAALFPRLDITVVLNGIDPAVARADPLDRQALAALGVQPPFVLASGGRAARKNVASLVEAWQALGSERYQLVVTGLSQTPVSARRVVLLRHLERRKYLRLLAASTAVVVPSLYEGFGLPVLEAMAAGKPVVATNRASLPEVAGGAALMCEPDPESLAEALETVVHDEEARLELQARGYRRAADFSWEKSARAHLRVYEAALQG